MGNTVVSMLGRYLPFTTTRGTASATDTALIANSGRNPQPDNADPATIAATTRTPDDPDPSEKSSPAPTTAVNTPSEHPVAEPVIESEIVTLDEHGDLYIVAKSKPHVKFLVSSTDICLASPVFDRMLHGSFAESLASSVANPGTVALDDDPEALPLVLRALCLCRLDTPVGLTPKLISEMAVIADKYDCVRRLAPHFSYWMVTFGKPTVPLGFARLATATITLDDRVSFDGLVAEYVLKSADSCLEPVTEEMQPDEHAVLLGARSARERMRQALRSRLIATTKLGHGCGCKCYMDAAPVAEAMGNSNKSAKALQDETVAIVLAMDPCDIQSCHKHSRKPGRVSVDHLQLRKDQALLAIKRISPYNYRLCWDCYRGGVATAATCQGGH